MWLWLVTYDLCHSFEIIRKTAKSYKKIWIPHWVATEHAVVRDIKVPSWKQVTLQKSTSIYKNQKICSSFNSICIFLCFNWCEREMISFSFEKRKIYCCSNSKIILCFSEKWKNKNKCVIRHGEINFVTGFGSENDIHKENKNV